jgi:hypothetical protein
VLAFFDSGSINVALHQAPSASFKHGIEVLDFSWSKA